jgi:hypothetical protein
MEAVDLANKAIAQRKQAQTLCDLMQNAATYVLYVLAQNKITYTTKWTMNGQDISAAAVTLTLLETYQEDSATVGDANLVVTLTGEMLKLGISEARSQFIKAQREVILKRINYNPQADGNLWEDFSFELTGETRYADLFRHWVWGIKQKLSGRISIDSVFPILCARAQGIGKSYACQLLTRILGDLATTTEVSAIIDQRNISMLSDYAVIICDEMSGMVKVEIDSLKNLVTTSSKTVRRLYDRDTENVTIMASFIGSSNKTVAEIIKDSSGNRRFLEVPCVSTISIPRLENFNYEAMWQSIDDKRPTGYWTPTLHEIKQEASEVAQEIHKTAVDSYLEDMGLSPGETLIPVTTFIAAFNVYCFSRNVTKPPRWNDLISSFKARKIKVSGSGVYLNKELPK